ncbi:hypothetical protein [Sphingomonas abietis]|uniref:Uncharacterized protein n=1 Tax=Sphingomonas abietis TaxID=3012344 RepID=A0ABY7NSS7_9SPHN|nr:hypothetical protein [Sphingomonas abietis]WBO24005.1 hypothetical protein PBT88_07815 [Sphingomonas abietis]
MHHKPRQAFQPGGVFDFQAFPRHFGRFGESLAQPWFWSAIAAREQESADTADSVLQGC